MYSRPAAARKGTSRDAGCSASHSVVSSPSRRPLAARPLSPWLPSSALPDCCHDMRVSSPKERIYREYPEGRGTRGTHGPETAGAHVRCTARETDGDPVGGSARKMGTFTKGGAACVKTRGCTTSPFVGIPTSHGPMGVPGHRGEVCLAWPEDARSPGPPRGLGVNPAGDRALVGARAAPAAPTGSPGVPHA